MITSRRPAPFDLLGMPYDRPVVGYGGKTINTLRLWAAAAPDTFDFAEFSAAISSAPCSTRPGRGVAHPRPLSGRFDRSGPDAALLAGVLPGRLLAGRHRTPLPQARTTTGPALPDKVAIQLNDTHPALAVAELMRILLDEAHWAGTRRGT